MSHPDRARDLLEMPQAFFKYQEPLETEMRAVMGDRPLPLYRMMAYHLGWIDAQANPAINSTNLRILASLCMAANNAANGDASHSLPAAVATELVHNFYLIHNDLQDGNPQRNGKDALWWVWGPAQAINAGDGMHALARQSLFRLKARGFSDEAVFHAIAMLDEASLKLCEGQFMDITFQERVDVSVKSYLKMIEDRTGAMMACALKLGALTASADSRIIDAFGKAGVKLSLAYQIQQDVSGLWRKTPEKSPAQASMLNKKKTMPVAYGMEKAGVREKRQIGEIYLKRVLENPDIQKVTSVLETLDVRQDCIKMAEQFYKESMSLVESTGLPSEELKELAQYLAFGDYREN